MNEELYNIIINLNKDEIIDFLSLLESNENGSNCTIENVASVLEDINKLEIDDNIENIEFKRVYYPILGHNFIGMIGIIRMTFNKYGTMREFAIYDDSKEFYILQDIYRILERRFKRDLEDQEKEIIMSKIMEIWRDIHKWTK